MMQLFKKVEILSIREDVCEFAFMATLSSLFIYILITMN